MTTEEYRQLLKESTKGPLLEWLTDRRDNCLRLASAKEDSDRAGWIEDASYFSMAIAFIVAAPEAVEELVRLREWRDALDNWPQEDKSGARLTAAEAALREMVK